MYPAPDRMPLRAVRPDRMGLTPMPRAGRRRRGCGSRRCRLCREDTTVPQVLKLNRFGVAIEVAHGTAEDLGTFDEDALSKAKALASAETDA